MHFSGHDRYAFDGVNVLVSRAFDTGRKGKIKLIVKFSNDKTLAFRNQPTCQAAMT
jgi:hypothetical protein